MYKYLKIVLCTYSSTYWEVHLFTFFQGGGKDQCDSYVCAFSAEPEPGGN